MKIMFLRVDLHRSKPLISLAPLICTSIVFSYRGIVMWQSLLFSQPIKNKLSNRCGIARFWVRFWGERRVEHTRRVQDTNAYFVPSHPINRSHGVMVSTLDFESSDPSSNLGETSLSQTFISFFCFCFCRCCLLLFFFFSLFCPVFLSQLFTILTYGSKYSKK